MKKYIPGFLFVYLFAINLTAQTTEFHYWDSLRIEFSQQKLYSQAIEATKKALTATQQTSGQEDTAVARQHFHLYELYLIQEDEEAIQHHLHQGIKILDKQNLQHSLYPIFATKLGDRAFEQQKFREAEKYYKKALASASLKHPEYASFLGNLAYFYLKSNNFRLAEEFSSRRIQHIESTSNPNQLEHAKALNSLAALLMEMGRYHDAEPLFLKSKKILEKIAQENQMEWARINNNLAYLYRRIGKYAEAEPLLLTALNSLKSVVGENHIYVSYSLNNLAVLYEFMDRGHDAISMYKKALTIMADNKGKTTDSYARALDNLAGSFHQLDSFQQAVRLYKAAINIKKQTQGTSTMVYAISLSNLAIVYKDQKRYEEAEQLFLEALAIKSKIVGPKHPSRSTSCMLLADYYCDRNQLEAAATYYKKAILANTLNIDSIASLDKLTIQKLTTYKYLSTEKTMEAFKGIYKYFQKQYQIVKDLKYLKKAQSINNVAIALLDSIRSSFDAELNKLEQLKKHSIIFDYSLENTLVLDSLSPSDSRTKEAFLITERNKSILLFEALKSQQFKTMGKVPTTIIQQQDSLIQEFNELEAAIRREKNQEQQIELQQSQIRLNSRIKEFKEHLKQNYPNYFYQSYSHQVVKIEEIQNRLDTKTALIEYHVGEKGVYVFYIDQQDVKVKQLTCSKNEIIERTQQLHAVLANYELAIKGDETAFKTFSNHSFWFYQKMLKDIIPTKAIDHLIIIPDHILGHLPFEVFLTERLEEIQTYQHLPYLLHKYSISYNYSASLWKEHLDHKSLKTNGNILAVAASYSQSNNDSHIKNRSPYIQNLRDRLDDLPEAKAEVQYLSKKYVGSYLLGDKATEPAFKRQAKNYSIIHLALHGLLNEDYAILSSLAFTEDGDSLTDNFLEAWEISQMELQADLVVLSACETGYGRFETGNGIASLARSFMYAGVPALVVSLWQVNDQSTSLIMQNFYANLAKGMDKARALQQAKLVYIAEVDNPMAAHPAFWAPFIQLGDSRPVRLKQKSEGSWIWLTAGGVGLLGLLGFLGLRRRKRAA